MKSVLAVLLLAGTASAIADEYVRPHARKVGASVEGHNRSNQNKHFYDNYSSLGNTNLYASQRGKERNEFSTPPAYHQQGNGPSERKTKG